MVARDGDREPPLPTPQAGVPEPAENRPVLPELPATVAAMVFHAAALGCDRAAREQGRARPRGSEPLSG
jgi:hypothetical protein